MLIKFLVVKDIGTLGEIYMETFFEILKVAIPALVTGMFTFIITRYTYKRNVPLEKMELAYNRIYYPIYIILKRQNKKPDIDFVISKSLLYLNKYSKYADASTLNAFKLLHECKNNSQKDDLYQNFKNNIYAKNSYLRRRLGYLEPNFLQTYKYSSKSEKSTYRISVEALVMYICLIIGSETQDTIQSIFVSICAVFFIILIIEIIFKFIGFIWYRIKK